MTTRGLGQDEFRQIAHWMVAVLRKPDDDELIGSIAAQVREMLTAFPVPG